MILYFDGGFFDEETIEEFGRSLDVNEREYAASLPLFLILVLLAFAVNGERRGDGQIDGVTLPRCRHQAHSAIA